eukprot:sb/3460801/
MLTADPTPFIRSCHATKFNATSKYLSQEVYELFHKHRMSIRSELYNDPFFITGSSIAASDTESRLSVADRLRKISKSYLELLVTVCLWYTRSRYRQGTLSREVFDSNCEVRLVSVEFLTSLVQQCTVLPTELRRIVCETLFERCHLQESILYVLQRSIVAHTESSYIVLEDHELLEWTKSFQSELIVLVQCILELEKAVGWGEVRADHLNSYEFDYKYVEYYMNCQDTHIAKVRLVDPEVETSNNPRYLPGVPLVAQPLFTHCILVALTTRRVTFLHKKWLDTVISCLDYSSPLLTKLSELVVQQILHNIRQLAREYHNTTSPPPVVSCVPVNQTALLLEALSSVVHFILIHAPSAPNNNNQTSKAGILEFFSFGSDVVSGGSNSPELEHVNHAKHAMLQMIPRCMDTLLDVWVGWKMIDPERAEGLFPWGKPHDIKTLLLNFVSPLFRRYPASMLSSLCEVWHMNRKNLVFGRPGHLVSSASKRQLALIDLLLDVKVCTFDVVLKNSQKLLNTAASHPKDSRDQFGFSFETELMHLSYEYFKHLKKHVMSKAWPHLLHLLREANTFTSQPPVTLLSLAFLHLYLTNCPTTDDVKSRRELQEVTVKLVELTTDIASRSLSGHTWFGRRSEVVPEYKEVVSVRRADDSEDTESEYEDEEGYEGSNVHTLQAIYALSECLASIIDLVYGSEEKDKAVTILTPLISKISVYIRNHAHHNMPNARASAALLTSITDYQYCRKAWAKELYDAFLEPDFFVMEVSGVAQWKIIIEHLIAHDTLLFQDMLARVTGASAGILSSSEAFYTQKARLIKRLTFTMYCCEYNQYAKFISKIQECFVEAVWVGWKMIDPERAEGLFPWGKPHDIKTLLLNFVSPLFRRYPASMLSSLCEVWHMNRKNLVFGRPGHLVSSASKRQLALIDLLLDVKVCTFDVVLKNSQKLLNTAASHPKDSRDQFGFSFETELMHLSYEFFKHLKKHVMSKAWPHLLHLLREANTFTSQPPVTLLSLAFLHLYLTNCPTTDDVKSRRELQEVTVKLVELTTDIASRSLSGHTWFGRRSEVVPEYKEVVSVRRADDSEDTESEYEDEEGYEGSNVHTLQAIYALSECLASIIDLVYGSEEKDKAVTILTPLISKISVYIRNHAHHNMPNARASAALLTSITDYQYCRKAWAKELYDAFLEPDFFVMEVSGVAQWKIIIEHLIAHDTLLFQDMLARVTGASAGILSSSEAFYTQKARLIKRLTFTMYCCEYNQYAKFISKIQECFVEALKLSTAAHQVVREVFLGFRVLILRMAPGTYSPLWPIMLNELYGQLVELRDLLRKQSDWEMSTNALSMYLSVSKLLDMALILPAEMIPDFQVHHWSFVCDRPREVEDSTGPVPKRTGPEFECLASEISHDFDRALEDDSWKTEIFVSRSPNWVQLCKWFGNEVTPCQRARRSQSVRCLRYQLNVVPKRTGPEFECLASEISHDFDRALEDDSWISQLGTTKWFGNEVTPCQRARRSQSVRCLRYQLNEWTESELDKFVVGSRDYLSEQFAILPLKIALPITEIFLLCWENSYLINATRVPMLLTVAQSDKVMGGSILSGKNAKCSES